MAKPNGMLRGKPPAEEPEAAPPEEAETEAAGASVPDDEPEPNVSPDEQKGYARFVDKGLQMIYAPQGFPAILEGLKGGGDPIEGLASTTALVVSRLYEMAARAGDKIDPAVMLQGGKELMQGLADAAERAKIHDFTPDELQGAAYRAMDHVREILIKSGKIDPEALKAEFAQVAEADKAGTLGQMVPGLEGEAKPPPAQGRGMLESSQ